MLSNQGQTMKKRGSSFLLVLNDNSADLFKSSNYIVKKLRTDDKTIVFIACIKHELDYDDVEHRYKTPHYHVVFSLDGTFRVETILNWVSDLFKCSKNQVSVDVCNSLYKQVRYLVHLDDLDKYQYSRYDIVTSSEKVVNDYLNMIYITDMVDCISIVQKYGYDGEKIMSVVGNYDKWRKYICDLIRFHNDNVRLRGLY